MADYKDIVVENGVLKGYRTPGGDVVIPRKYGYVFYTEHDTRIVIRREKR